MQSASEANTRAGTCCWLALRRGALRRVVVLAGCVLLTVSACERTEELPPGRIARAVEEAKAEGRRAVEIRAGHDYSWSNEWPLRFALHRHAAVLVLATGRTLIKPQPDFIQTWHVFRRLEYISGSGSKPEHCNIGITTEALALGQDEIAFPLNQGTITVRGVTVSMDSPHSEVAFERGTKFLMIVGECQGGIVTSPFGRRGMFAVLPDGKTIRIGVPEEEIPRFAAEVQELGTVDRFRERAAELRRISGPLPR